MHVIVNTPQAGQLEYIAIMHECSNHMQHEGEPQGLYVVTHKCIILQTSYTHWQCLIYIIGRKQAYYNTQLQVYFDITYLQDEGGYYDILVQMLGLLRSNYSGSVWGVVGPGDDPNVANFIAPIAENSGLITVRLTHLVQN